MDKVHLRSEGQASSEETQHNVYDRTEILYEGSLMVSFVLSNRFTELKYIKRGKVTILSLRYTGRFINCL